jgi:hypothetical protein
MDTQNIVAQLRQELARIDQAISALEGLGQTAPRRGRPPKAASDSQVGGRGRRRMSAAARAKIAAAQRARWARQKGQAGTKQVSAAQKKAARRRPMSPAARKRLLAMMKARWAARKKGGQA